MARAPSPARTRYSWYVVAVLTLANVSGFVDRQILSLLVRPIKRDLGISDTQMSYLIGLAFSLLFAVLGLPIARLADRWNRRTIMAAGVGLWSVFTSACAIAKTYAQLLVLRVGVGVGEASLNAPGISLIADYFPRARRARAMSVYSLGIFLGSGLAYIIGGAIVGLAAERGSWTWPLVGAIRPWQAVFLAVGLPGFVVAGLLFTIREPARSGIGGPPATPVPLRALYDHVVDNLRTYVAQCLGFACSAAVNFGIAAWLATFFVRTYGWGESRAGRVQGLLTTTIGVLGVLAGGWVADWFVKRGRLNAPLRVGIIGAAGMLVSATAYPLMPTAGLAVAWLAAVNFFAAFPWGAASAGAAEIVPAPMRTQGIAIYFFVLNLVSATLGPTSVAWFTDYVFRDEGSVRYSLVAVNVIGMTFALTFFSLGLVSYSGTVAKRERWEEQYRRAVAGGRT
jgi:MFS family permease